ncbi:MAG TPA: Clp protease N-terminal domain-containing protein, partial [Candidatus Saccharibacteria bacterium]|nr:Clp protease N-terminal domain-containing protein [Candidatus Saccharibacteria bacterium]
MFERFTNEARQAIVRGDLEARKLQHNYLGTEHLLLGLAMGDGDVASLALTQLGISADAVREGIEQIVGRGEVATGHVPFTPRAKAVMEGSLREALQLGTNFINPEHLLLGIIREDKNFGAQVIAHLGVSLEDVHSKIHEVLDIGVLAQQPAAE